MSALEAAHARRLSDAVGGPCRRALQAVVSHKWSWPFLAPVDVRMYPDYPFRVAQPMDLGEVRRRLDAGEYATPAPFLRDVRLVFSNATTYNAPGSDVHVMAAALRARFEDRVAAGLAPRRVEDEALRLADRDAARAELRAQRVARVAHTVAPDAIRALVELNRAALETLGAARRAAAVAASAAEAEPETEEGKVSARGESMGEEGGEGTREESNGEGGKGTRKESETRDQEETEERKTAPPSRPLEDREGQLLNGGAGTSRPPRSEAAASPRSPSSSPPPHVSSTRSTSASSSDPISSLVSRLSRLSQPAFDRAMGVVLRAHPGLCSGSDVAFDVDALDALTLGALDAVANLYDERGADANDGGEDATQAKRGRTEVSWLWPCIAAISGEPAEARDPRGGGRQGDGQTWARDEAERGGGEAPRGLETGVARGAGGEPAKGGGGGGVERAGAADAAPAPAEAKAEPPREP